MTTDIANYAISGETFLSFGEAVEKARALLQRASYVVLSGIDVQAKFKEKLDIEREPYLILGACKILGACNPPLANHGLNAKPELGTLLPCNVVIYEQVGRTRVAAVEPGVMLSVVGNKELKPSPSRSAATWAEWPKNSSGTDELEPTRWSSMAELEGGYDGRLYSG